MNSKTDIIEINEQEFEEKVVKASSSSLILVDFWAPWCGPCKQLTPILEKVITKSKGKVKLVKINIDENQQISSQLQIKSIPAVFAFKDGQPTDAFQGVIPEKQIIEFIEKSLGEKMEEDFTEFYDSIYLLIEDKKYQDAKDILEDFLIKNPSEFRSFALYIECFGYLGEYDEAKKFCETLDKDALANELIDSAIQKIEIKKKNVGGPTIESLLELVQKNPNDINCIINLADKYFSENILDEAFELLLGNYKKNKEDIKAKFIEYFKALGNDNEMTIVYRKKLSSIMFS